MNLNRAYSKESKLYNSPKESTGHTIAWCPCEICSTKPKCTNECAVFIRYTNILNGESRKKFFISLMKLYNLDKKSLKSLSMDY